MKTIEILGFKAKVAHTFFSDWKFRETVAK